MATPIIPGQLNVIKRDGTPAAYDDNRIKKAIAHAFIAVEGNIATGSDRIHEIVDLLTQQVTNTFLRHMPTGGSIRLEYIQDQVELALMRAGEHQVARAYVLYREQRRQEREEKAQESQQTAPQLTVILSDGSRKPLDLFYLKNLIDEACEQLESVNPQILFDETLRNLFDGVPVKEVNKALQLSARTLIEKEPDYTFVAARLLLDELHNEAFQFLGLPCSNLT